jgi:hypothetical protein
MTGKNVGMRRQTPLRRPKAAKKTAQASVRHPIQPGTGTIFAGSALMKNSLCHRHRYRF